MSGSGTESRFRGAEASEVASSILSEIRVLRSRVDDLFFRLTRMPAEEVELMEPATSDRALYATLLGPFSIRRNGEVLPIGSQRITAELCRYLIAHAGRPTPRAELVELIWPEADPVRSQHRLHNAVSSTRRILDRPDAAQSVLRLEDDAYLIVDGVVVTDCDVFDRHYRAARRSLAQGDRSTAARDFRSALSLYAGDYVSDEPYVNWAQQQRLHLSEQRLNALTFLCEQAADDGDLVAVIEYGQFVLDVDDLRERAHRHVMRAHYGLGQRGCALRQFQRCAELLRRDLDAAPSRVTRELFEAIRDDAPLPPEIPIRL